MKAFEAVGLIAVGSAIGLGAGYLAFGRPASAPAAPPSAEPTCRCECSHDSRESRSAPLAAALAPLGSSGALAASNPAPGTGAAPPNDPRVGALAHDVDDALRDRDEGRLLALMDELAPLGRAAWPQLYRIALATLRKTDHHWTGAFTDMIERGEGHELALEALLDGTSYTRTFRRAAASYSNYLDKAVTPEARARALAQLGVETDADCARALVHVATGDVAEREKTLGPELLAIMRAQRSPEMRLAILGDFWHIPAAAFEEIARTDPDAEVRTAAKLRLVASSATARGFLVNDGKAAPLLACDLVLTIDGKPVKDWTNVSQVDGKACRLTILRDGQTLDIVMPAGHAGIAGHMVGPTDPGDGE